MSSPCRCLLCTTLLIRYSLTVINLLYNLSSATTIPVLHLLPLLHSNLIPRSQPPTPAFISQSTLRHSITDPLLPPSYLTPKESCPLVKVQVSFILFPHLHFLSSPALPRQCITFIMRLSTSSPRRSGVTRGRQR